MFISASAAKTVEKGGVTLPPHRDCEEIGFKANAMKPELIHAERLKNLVQTLVMNKSETNYLNLLPKAVSDLATPIDSQRLSKHILCLEKKAKEESLKHKRKTKFKNFKPYILQMLLQRLQYLSIELNENRSTKSTKPNQVLRKRDRDDDDKDEGLPAGSNPGKEMKKQKSSKESDSSKKTSTPKDSSKGTSPSQTSKPGKTKTTQEAPEEPSFEMGTNTAEQPSSES
ncbi:hypothetical protein Tco_1066770 [Tanacetum coccineum]|uniref:Uncharacterized protein n=1 Tax=Tanacetum coccineum TaxID=301880 RepID=A0ABQ5HAX3_9ASTR